MRDPVRFRRDKAPGNAKVNDAALEALNNYRALIENSLTGMAVVQDRKIVFNNPKMSEIMGYTREEAMNRDIYTFIHPDDRERVNNYYINRISGREAPEQYEFKAVTKSGQTRIFEMRPTLISYNGRPAVLMNVIDVTDRSRIQEALLESEEEYRNLVEQIFDWVWEVDENSVYTYASPRIRELLGYEPEEVCGRSPFDFMPPQDAERVAAMFKPIAEKREPFTLLENTLVRKDGRLVVVETSGMPIFDAAGTFRGYRGIDRDITDRKLAEEHRIELEKRLDAQKRQFYRETILSVTDGKLDICDAPDIAKYISKSHMRIDVADPYGAAEARHRVENYCAEQGLEGDRLELFLMGVGEAIANAVKHGTRARVYAGSGDGFVWVGISDRGEGISSLILPRATLLRGFSTKPSLGLGYSIILDVADHILLKTGEHGTAVVLIKNLEELAVVTVADRLPDTWRDLPN
ncbi:MAG: PAS domain S-box protein [Armatimonadetes bacterium]|nr:PAS domain S-box protein [Armatimonadota bacterium]